MKALFALGKPRIAALTTLSAATGYLLAGGGLTWPLVQAVAGTALLAAAAAALNQIQERRFDARMRRTQDRPLPAGRVSLRGAWTFSALSGALGAALLWLAGGPPAVGLGVLAMALYNLVYTSLKRVSSLAVLPGALIGAVPPAMGWVCAGGRLTDPRLAVLSFFFFIWQMPHFWLLLLMHHEDYERGGFPTLTRRLGREGVARITFVWSVATAAAALLFPYYGATTGLVALVGLGLLAAWVAMQAMVLLRLCCLDTARIKRLFVTLNLFALTTMLLLLQDRIGA